MADIETVEQYVADKRIRPQLATIARDLRGLADDIEQQAEWLALSGAGKRDYSRVAAMVTQQIMNALPGFQLGALAQYAAEADVARAKGE